MMRGKYTVVVQSKIGCRSLKHLPFLKISSKSMYNIEKPLVLRF